MIEGLVTEKELERLKHYAALSGITVEIGSYKGKSAIGMASVTFGKVYYIDLWSEHPKQKRYQTARQAFDRNVSESKFGYKIIPIQGRSSDVVRDWTLPIDFLFIDGCHKYDYVRSDFEKWSPFVDRWIAFHDYAPKAKSGKDVFRFVNELMAETDVWERVELTEKLFVIGRKR